MCFVLFMTLYIIGIGLYDERDITLRGLDVVKSCDEIYLEHYTSILGVDVGALEKLYNKKITIASRDLVEKEAEEKLLLPAKEKNIALLIVGDVFGATTHTDLQLRAKELAIPFQVIFNASVMNAIGVVGLELYKYGKTTSIVFPDNNWLPTTPYDVIKENQTLGLHTLCLLDIKVAEPSLEDIKKGINKPQAPRYMTVKQGIEILMTLEEQKQEKVITKDTLVVGVARLGHPDMKILAGTVEQLLTVDFGEPLHSLIVPGKLHHIEEDALKLWKI